MSDDFDSLNPYDNLVFLVANSPEELTEQIHAIGTRIKLIGHPTFAQGKWYWWVMGDIRGVIRNRKRALIRNIQNGKR